MQMYGRCSPAWKAFQSMLIDCLYRAMTRDPAKYKDPEIFNPDRFLTETGELNDDEVTYAFGFGRR